MMNNTTQKTGNQPSHILYHVPQDDSDSKYWQKIGAAWEHKDGKGFSLQIDYIPVNSDGRLALRLNEPKAEQTDTQAAA